MLENLHKTLSNIHELLLNDPIIRKLLGNDNNNALQEPVPDIEKVRPYITMAPIFNFGIKGSADLNSKIGIFIAEVEPQTETSGYTALLMVHIVTNQDKWELLNQVRPMAIADRVIELLQYQKLDVAVPIDFSLMQHLVINENITGYSLSFFIGDRSAGEEL